MIAVDDRAPKLGKLSVLLANVRGLRQAAADLRKLTNLMQPHRIALVETHMQKGPLRGLLSAGYTAISRLDRTKHGGGLL